MPHPERLVKHISESMSDRPKRRHRVRYVVYGTDSMSHRKKLTKYILSSISDLKNPISSSICILRDGLEVASTNTRKIHIRIDAGLQQYVSTSMSHPRLLRFSDSENSRAFRPVRKSNSVSTLGPHHLPFPSPADT